MVQDTTQQAAEQSEPGARPRPTPMAMCPMASMCGGMMKTPHSGFLLMLPGAVLIVVGVLIFLEPAILVWLMGTASVLLGIMFLMMARFMRRIGGQLRNM